ncbi:MAG: S8 family peptidase [Candidatus Aenigmatarchaeota archaeon]
MKKLLALLLLALLLPLLATAQSPRSRFIARTNLRFIPVLHGCKILHELNDATAVECSEAAVELMKKFVSVEEDQIYYIMDLQADVQIGADKVWAQGYTGSGIVIAILDTGVDLNHPELVDSIAGGKSFVSYTESFQDDNGHGTHVAGIITANGLNEQAKGVAPDALIWAAKVCDSSGSCYSSDIAAAIEYVVNNRIAKIISISLGGGGTTKANCDSDYLAQKVNWAVSNGVTVVAAAGNTGGKVASPACASKAIAVGAVDKSDKRPSWSGSGSALDIVAPGVSIYSTIPGGYASWSGTSMATPHVSAVVALLLQANSALTDSQIKDALYKTAKDLGSAGWDKYYGYGRVDAHAALNYVLAPPTTTTTTLPCLPRLSSCTSNEQCCSGYCRRISSNRSICW